MGKLSGCGVGRNSVTLPIPVTVQSGRAATSGRVISLSCATGRRPAAARPQDTPSKNRFGPRGNRELEILLVRIGSVVTVCDTTRTRSVGIGRCLPANPPVSESRRRNPAGPADRSHRLGHCRRHDSRSSERSNGPATRTQTAPAGQRGRRARLRQARVRVRLPKFKMEDSGQLRKLCRLT